MPSPTSLRIPAENITRQYAQIRDEIAAAIAAVLPTGRYTLGPQVAAFEQEFAAPGLPRSRAGYASSCAILRSG